MSVLPGLDPIPSGDRPLPCRIREALRHRPLPIDGLHLDVGGRDVAVLICRDCGVLHVAAADAEEIGRVTDATRGG